MRCLHIAMVLVVALHLFGEEMGAAGAPASTYSITDLGSLGGGRTSPMGINNRGAVVGFSATVDGLTRAFLYTGGSLVDLGTLGGDDSFAYRISDNGIIVGRAQDSSGRFHAFVTTFNGGAIELNALNPRADGDFGAALGVNSVGEVAGYYLTEGDHMSARNRVFYYRDFRVEDLGAFGGEDGVVVAVNDRGSLAGFFSAEPHADYAEHRSFLFTRGKLVPIGSLGGQLTTARDLNNRDEMVGDGDTGDGEHHAFLFAAWHITRPRHPRRGTTERGLRDQRTRRYCRLLGRSRRFSPRRHCHRGCHARSERAHPQRIGLGPDRSTRHQRSGSYCRYRLAER